MLSKCLISIVAVLFVAFTSKADPVVVIGEGHNITPEGGFEFNLRNSDNTVSTHLGTELTVNPVSGHSAALPGQPINLDFAGSGLAVTGTLTVNGITYPADLPRVRHDWQTRPRQVHPDQPGDACKRVLVFMIRLTKH